MIIEGINIAERRKMWKSLQRYTESLKRRDINMIIHPHSGYVASIDVIVTGRKGSAQKSVVVVYDHIASEWNVFCEGNKYVLLALSDLQIVLKNMVNKLGTLLSKI